MLILRLVVRMLSIGCMVLSTAMGSAQDFPIKPIRIVTSPAGGGPDLVARLVGQGISNSWGQQVIVDNRPAGIIPGEIVFKASSDGYTLLAVGSTLWLAQFLQDDVPFDVVRDFSPITLAVTSPNILVVHPSLLVNSVQELIALAKRKPGELNYAAAGLGSPSHLAMELFKAMAGVNIVAISYRGSGPALSDLMGGHVQLGFFPAAAGAEYAKSGRLRALAVTSAKPSALFPGVPTVAAVVPGYASEVVIGIFAPAKTPEPIVNRLNQEIVRVLNGPDVKEKLLSAGTETVGSSPGEFATALKSEMDRLGKVIKDAGIRAY